MQTCPGDDSRKQVLWHKGWDEGRSGELHPSEDDPTFVLGFIQGEVALEEAQNSENYTLEGLTVNPALLERVVRVFLYFKLSEHRRRCGAKLVFSNFKM